jgi:glycosyltransferase involved in cell wall biosynthesis
MTRPKVTVIIVTHNDQEFLTVSLESVFRQTYQNIEVIVCDQNSDDETYSILKCLEDARLRISESAEANYFAAVNEAVRLATGDFILEFPAKAIMKPATVESLVAMMQKNEVLCVVSQFVKVDANGLIINRPKLPTPGDEMSLELLLSDKLANAPLFLRRSFINNSPYKVPYKQPKLALLWSINKGGKLLSSSEYLVATRSTKSTAGLWSKRYGAFKSLWQSPKVLGNLVEEERESYGEKLVKLYKLALKKRDYLFGLIVFVCVLRLPGYRHEFLRMIRQGE